MLHRLPQGLVFCSSPTMLRVRWPHYALVPPSDILRSVDLIFSEGVIALRMGGLFLL